MTFLVIESWLLLISLELALRSKDLSVIYDTVRRAKVKTVPPELRPASEALCHAMDLACVFYFRKVKCLQHSVATTRLLRHYGWPAEMVTGVQMVPFKSHAWVEINGVVVNDKPYMRDIYEIVERNTADQQG